MDVYDKNIWKDEILNRYNLSKSIYNDLLKLKPDLLFINIDWTSIAYIEYWNKKINKLQSLFHKKLLFKKANRAMYIKLHKLMSSIDYYLSYRDYMKALELKNIKQDLFKSYVSFKKSYSKLKRNKK